MRQAIIELVLRYANAGSILVFCCNASSRKQ